MDRPYTVFENPLVHDPPNPHTGFEDQTLDDVEAYLEVLSDVRITEIVDAVVYSVCDVDPSFDPGPDFDAGIGSRPTGSDPRGRTNVGHSDYESLNTFEASEGRYWTVQKAAETILAAQQYMETTRPVIHHATVAEQATYVADLARISGSLNGYNIAVEALISSLQTAKRCVRDFRDDHPEVTLNIDVRGPRLWKGNWSSLEGQLLLLEYDGVSLEWALTEVRSRRAELQ